MSSQKSPAHANEGQSSSSPSQVSSIHSPVSPAPTMSETASTKSNLTKVTTMPSIIPVIEACHIKIVLVSIRMDQGFFDRIVQMFRAHNSKITVQEFSEHEGFILQRVNKKASLCVSYLTEVFCDFEDFEDFQLYRRVFGVIGVCPDVAHEVGKEELVKEFERQLIRYPHSLLSQLISFEPLHDSDESFFEQTIKSRGREFLGRLVGQYLPTLAEQLKRPGSQIATPRGLDLAIPKEMQHKLKARMLVRASKLLADLYILCGAYGEAVGMLASAVEESKASGDLAWQAAAQEAFLIALALNNDALLVASNETTSLSLSSKTSTLTTSSADIWGGIPEKLAEVSRMYEKVALAILAWDVYRTIGAITRRLGRPAESVLYTCKSWHCCESMHAEEKMLALAAIIEQLESMEHCLLNNTDAPITPTFKCTRKISFFQVKLSSILRQLSKPELAMRVLELAMKPFGYDPSAGHFDERLLVGPRLIHAALLKELVGLAEFHSNRLLFIHFSLLYLWLGCGDTKRKTSHQMSSSNDFYVIEAQKTLDRLGKWVKGMSVAPYIHDATHLLPLFKSCSMIEQTDITLDDNDNNVADSKAKEYSEKPSGFIYAPSSRRRDSNSTTHEPKLTFLVCQEVATFEIILCNPLPLALDFYLTFKLSKTTEEFSDALADVEMVKCSLPARASAYKQPISLTPRRNITEELIIEGVEIEFLGISLCFPWKQSFKVLDIQPLLCMSGDPTITVQPPPEWMFLYEGEQKSLSIVLPNMSNAPIDHFKATCQPKFGKDSSKMTCSEEERGGDFYFKARTMDILYGGAALDQNVASIEQLLANDGKYVSMKLSITGFLGLTELQIQVSYGRKKEKSVSRRTLSFFMKCSVGPVFELRDVRVLPFNPTLLSNFNAEQDDKDDHKVYLRSTFNVSSTNSEDFSTEKMAKQAVSSSSSCCILTFDLVNVAVNGHHQLRVSFANSDQCTIAPCSSRRICLLCPQLETRQDFSYACSTPSETQISALINLRSSLRAYKENVSASLTIPSKIRHMCIEQVMKYLGWPTWKLGNHHQGRLALYRAPFDSLLEREMVKEDIQLMEIFKIDSNGNQQHIQGTCLEVKQSQISKLVLILQQSNADETFELEMGLVKLDDQLFDDSPKEDKVSIEYESAKNCPVGCVEMKCQITCHVHGTFLLIYRAKSNNKKGIYRPVWCKKPLVIKCL